MGSNSRYASVPQSDEVLFDHRSDKVRAQDFGNARRGGNDDAAAALPLEEDGLYGQRRRMRRGDDEDSLSWYTLIKRSLILGVLVTVTLALGFCAGSKHQQMKGCGGSGGSSGSMSSGHEHQGASSSSSDSNGGLLPPQSLVPDIPIKPIAFEFPTKYGEATIEADKLWDKLMPLGAGFIRVPYPRKYDLNPSKPIEDDPEEAEIYSLSSLHQLHCLAVIRDVIKHYQSPNPESGPSHFVGHGHEWHCIDYIRQGIMCSADTTLDFAGGSYVDAQGQIQESRGFTGNNSTHQCRDWDTVVEWAIASRSGNRTSIA